VEGRTIARQEPPLDAALTGGELVTGGRSRRATLGIRDRKIASLTDPDVPVNAHEVIDARGLVVLPGLVDAHVHLREPGFEAKEGFETGTMAAAAGGVTTVMAMPTTRPTTSTPEAFEDKVRRATGKAYVDFAIQALVADDLSPVDALARLGAVSFELFLGDVPPPLLAGDNRAVLEAFERIAAIGGIAGVTCSDDAIIQRELARLHTAGDKSPRAFARSRPSIAEALGVARAGLLAARARARIHFRQISCRESITMLAALRRMHPGISAETTPHNLLLTEDELDRQGPYAKVTPPLRSPEDLDALFAALRDGTIDIVATDHAPHLPAEKEAGWSDIWQAPGGFPGLQTLLPLMLEEVARGRFTLGDLVLLCCERPARLFGLYPQKGALEPGSDADLVLVDPKREASIENESQLSRARVTPFAGRRVRGWPVATFLRGRVIMRDGRIVGRPTGTLVVPRAAP